MYLRLSATPGSEQTLPREAPARRVVHRRPFFSRANRWAVAWEGRGATARRRDAKWSSGVAAVFWVYYNENVFKDPFGHHHVHYRGALYNMDIYTYSVIMGKRGAKAGSSPPRRIPLVNSTISSHYHTIALCISHHPTKIMS